MTKERVKELVLRAIDKDREKIIAIGESIYESPELGYREVESSRKVSNFLQDLGLEVEESIAITGCRAQLNKSSSGPCIALMGEIDAIAVQEHPNANSNGNVHGCGHHAQIAGLLGATLGLVQSGALSSLHGRVDILATPAEEFIELEYRSQLRESGEITFFGGKQELIYRGYFDNVDMAMMFHSLDLGENQALLGPVSNGFIGKNIRYIGKESHAGSAPEQGVNALNAATLGIMNIHAQRDTFMDKDRVRVHPIITQGGDIVNVVPGEVKMETFVRARSVDAMVSANVKVQRALEAGALAIGADLEVQDIPGYLPILRYHSLDTIFQKNLEDLGLEGKIVDGGDFTGSFDFGDISQIMPAIHPMIGGVRGAIHTKEFTIEDKELAYIVPAKAMALTVVDLLFDKGALANQIIQEEKPPLTKQAYLELMESFANNSRMENLGKS